MRRIRVSLADRARSKRAPQLQDRRAPVSPGHIRSGISSEGRPRSGRDRRARSVLRGPAAKNSHRSRGHGSSVIAVAADAIFGDSTHESAASGHCTTGRGARRQHPPSSCRGTLRNDRWPDPPSRSWYRSAVTVRELLALDPANDDVASRLQRVGEKGTEERVTVRPNGAPRRQSSNSRTYP